MRQAVHLIVLENFANIFCINIAEQWFLIYVPLIGGGPKADDL